MLAKTFVHEKNKINMSNKLQVVTEVYYMYMYTYAPVHPNQFELKHKPGFVLGAAFGG